MKATSLITQKISQLETLIDAIAKRSKAVAGMIACQLNDLDAAHQAGVEVNGELDTLAADANTYLVCLAA